MALANFHAWMIGRNQRTGNAIFHFIGVAQQTFRVVHLEGQTDNSGHRCKSDPALAKSEFQADNFFAFKHTLADYAGIGN